MASARADAGTFSGTGARPKFQVNQVCRYFLHGACNRADDCRYSHDRTRTVPADNVCRYYLAGTCTYGSRCRYDHTKAGVTKAIPPSELEINDVEKEKNFSQVKSNMVKLTKGGIDESLAVAQKEKERDTFEKKWVAAKDFVPGKQFHGSGSYAGAVQPDFGIASGGYDPNLLPPTELTDKDLLCPYYSQGHCPYEDQCQYLHGDLCDMCCLPLLHPTNKELRDAHVKECLDEHTREMELAFLMKESNEKECGICLEVIKDKVGETGGSVDRRFGLLENCVHCFCLTCIKEWRNKRVAEKKTHRSCPVCRTHSNFVTPSEFWVEGPEEKKQLIADYLATVGKKPCQYFKQGKGECPFYDKCFYLHALPDGSIAPPQSRPKRRHRTDAWGEDHLVEEYDLWDYFFSRDTQNQSLTLDDELSLIWLEALHDLSDDSDSGHPFSLGMNFNHGDFAFTDSDSSDTD